MCDIFNNQEKNLHQNICTFHDLYQQIYIIYISRNFFANIFYYVELTCY